MYASGDGFQERSGAKYGNCLDDDGEFALRKLVSRVLTAIQKCVISHDMKGNETRPYHSPSRDQQVAQTRNAIVEALAAQVYEESLADFSVPKVARRAGVSTRTVYRYFPTRDDLLAAVEGHVAEVAPEPAPPLRREDLVPYVSRLFGYFDTNVELIETQLNARLAGELATRSRERRQAEALRTLDGFLGEDVDEREGLKQYGLLRGLVSSRLWLLLTRELGLENEEATEIVSWAVGVLLANLDDRITALKEGGRDDGKRG